MVEKMMDSDAALELDVVFQALANATRREILARLADREHTVGELAEPLAMSLAAASKHIKVLERVGLVRQTVSGRTHVCRLEPLPLAAASDWLGFYERFWRARLDALEALMDEDFYSGSQPHSTSGKDKS
jgi:DNA-binding transcriptional ArsR family regulator